MKKEEIQSNHLYGIITRMSVFSFAFKVIAIATFIWLLQYNLSFNIMIKVSVLTMILWIIDAKYLCIERKVRTVYKKTVAKLGYETEPTIPIPEVTTWSAMFNGINAQLYLTLIILYVTRFV